MFPDTWIIRQQIPLPKTESLWGWKRHPTVTLFPIGDLHLEAIGCHEKEWADFCSFILSEEDSYLCCLGDMFDNAVKTSKVANPFDSRYRPMEAKNIIAEYLKPIKDKLLCGTRGNHCQRSVKETDSDPLYDVFCRLNIEDRYRAGTAFLYLQIGERELNRTTGFQKKETRPIQSYKIIVNHGVGNGRMVGSGVNRQYQFGIAMDCDVLITGHTHQPTIAKPSRVVFDPKQAEIRTEPFVMVQCASWLQYIGYPLQKMLPPTTIWNNDCPQKIELCATRDLKLVKATM